MLPNPKTACMRGPSHLYPATASGPTCSKGPDLRPYFDVSFDETETIYVVPYEDIQRELNQRESQTSYSTIVGATLSIGEVFAEHYTDIQDFKNSIKVGRDVGIMGKMYTKTVEGKKYIIFKGRPGLRKIFTGTRYSVNNTKILSFGIGIGALAKSAIRGTVVGIVLINSFHVAKFFLEGDSSWQELVGTLIAESIKSALAAAAGLIVGGVLAATGLVAIPLAASVLAAWVVGDLLDSIDDRQKITEAIQDWVQKTAPLFQQTWSETVEGLEKGYGIVEAEVKETVEEVSTLAEQQYENFQTGRRYVSDQIAQGWDRWFQTLMANVPAY